MLKVMIKCQEGQMKQPQRMHYKKKQLQFLTTCLIKLLHFWRIISNYTTHSTLKRITSFGSVPILLQNLAFKQVDRKWTPPHLDKFQMSFQHFVYWLYKSLCTNDYTVLVTYLTKSKKETYQLLLWGKDMPFLFNYLIVMY